MRKYACLPRQALTLLAHGSKKTRVSFVANDGQSPCICAEAEICLICWVAAGDYAIATRKTRLKSLIHFDAPVSSVQLQNQA
jgi:hypothetical protein